MKVVLQTAFLVLQFNKIPWSIFPQNFLFQSVMDDTLHTPPILSKFVTLVVYGISELERSSTSWFLIRYAVAALSNHCSGQNRANYFVAIYPLIHLPPDHIPISKFPLHTE